MTVDVGPLTFNGDYVEQGSPMECLKGDVKFMSKRMKIKCPPLPPSTKKEFGMIKRFCATCTQAKQKDIQDICRSFKYGANSVDIFPKLPSMIKPSVKR